MTDIVQPTGEQEQRANWDRLLIDIELKQEQLRQLRPYEPWKLAFSGITAGAAFFPAGAAFVKLIGG